jgi:hypothetical protein
MLVRVQLAQVLDALGQHQEALIEYTRVVTTGLTGRDEELHAAGCLSHGCFCINCKNKRALVYLLKKFIIKQTFENLCV